MFRPADSIGRNLYVAVPTHDGTASQRKTPTESVQHKVYDGIARSCNQVTRQIMGCGSESNDCCLWDHDVP